MLSSVFDLTGKVAIITGSSRGIGLASARLMAQHGGRVVINGRNPETCKTAADQIDAEFSTCGGAALAIAANIGRRNELKNLVDLTLMKWGHIDIVMANASIHPWLGSMLDLQDETFSKFSQVNIQSLIWLAQMTVPGMLTRGYGRFIVVSSIMGMLGDSSSGAFALTKAANMQFVRNMAMEFAAGGICANCIAPGAVKTDLVARSPRAADPALLERHNQRNPSRRFGDVDEVAGLAVLLASRAGGYINGQTIPVDGGYTISGG